LSLFNRDPAIPCLRYANSTTGSSHRTTDWQRLTHWNSSGSFFCKSGSGESATCPGRRPGPGPTRGEDGGGGAARDCTTLFPSRTGSGELPVPGSCRRVPAGRCRCPPGPKLVQTDREDPPVSDRGNLPVTHSPAPPKPNPLMRLYFQEARSRGVALPPRHRRSPPPSCLCRKERRRILSVAKRFPRPVDRKGCRSHGRRTIVMSHHRSLC